MRPAVECKYIFLTKAPPVCTSMACNSLSAIWTPLNYVAFSCCVSNTGDSMPLWNTSYMPVRQLLVTPRVRISFSFRGSFIFCKSFSVGQIKSISLSFNSLVPKLSSLFIKGWLGSTYSYDAATLYSFGGLALGSSRTVSASFSGLTLR